MDEAVREFILEYPDDVVTVVVDATFGHRIPPEERKRFEEAELAGEVVSPPAGAIGRGDAFLLRVADKVGASVLSNDSFQEFHGDYEWLFDKGRLIGGKPVPGVGWIFTPRTPVRGPKSREAVKEAKRKKRADKVVEADESGLDMAERSKGRGGERKLQRAIAVAVDEAVEPAKSGHKRRRRNRSGETPSEPVNEPFTFITFIAEHHLGDEVEGTVDEFSSHGAFIVVDGARCYLPLSAMGEVVPRSARDVLRKGEKRNFIIQAFDAMRRGIELAMPGFAHVAGGPTPETVEAEIHLGEEQAGAEAVEAPSGAPAVAKRTRTGTRRAPAKQAAPDGGPVPAGLPVAVKKAAGAKKGTPGAKKGTPVEKAAPAKRGAPAKEAALLKPAEPGKRVRPPAKVVPEKAAPAKATPEKAGPVKAASPTAKKAAPAAKKAAPAANKAAPAANKGAPRRLKAVPGEVAPGAGADRVAARATKKRGAAAEPAAPRGARKSTAGQRGGAGEKAGLETPAPAQAAPRRRRGAVAETAQSRQPVEGATAAPKKSAPRKAATKAAKTAGAAEAVKTGRAGRAGKATTSAKTDDGAGKVPAARKVPGRRLAPTRATGAGEAQAPAAGGSTQRPAATRARKTAKANS